MFGALFRPERKNARAMRGEGEEKAKMKKGVMLTFPSRAFNRPAVRVARTCGG